MTTEEVFFALMRSILIGAPVEERIKEGIDADILSQLYVFSEVHDLAHLIGAALAKCGKLGDDDCSKKFRAKAMLAVSRYERINYDLQTICDALEQAQIPFIPLKGSVLRAYYPEPWMRTSCDIDVLVHNEDLEKAAGILQYKLGYSRKEKGQHDISFYSQSGIHVELHYDLVEKGWANAASDILNNVWNYAVQKKKSKYYFELSDDMFYYYHIAHMAKHIEQGGCGIKVFVDVWFLDGINGADYNGRKKLLDKGNLLKFAHASQRLSRVWMEEHPHDSITQQLQEYVFRGGAYGMMRNRIAALQRREGGKWRYLISKFIIPYDVIKFIYPVLQKHRWLTPIYQVRRWIGLVYYGQTKRVIKELSYNQRLPKEQAQALEHLFKELGL
ncbi:MAG: nucleotidyltransferase family protein [Oscillospiraceae bacterium]|nr:nucleotidyltransferase family protein [Oscillospiraceae bacterium]